jgi:hypothetical protein
MTGGLSRPQPLGIISDQIIIKQGGMHPKDYNEFILEIWDMEGLEL